MAKENCYNLQPGTIMGYQGESWQVTAHDTLSRRFTIRSMNPPFVTKSFSYSPGQEVEIRWKPNERR